MFFAAFRCGKPNFLMFFFERVLEDRELFGEEFSPLDEGSAFKYWRRLMNNEIEFLATSDLHFDPQNPRFGRVFDGEQPEDLVIERMVVSENIQELMGSISEQGYFIGEPLLVVDAGDGSYVVVEGNRRLAALKLLNGQIRPKKKVPSIDQVRDAANHTPDSVPCQVFSDRKEILRYLGYRHITGAKRWDSLSKAKYIKQLLESFYQDYDIDEAAKSIAKEIGSRKDYVAQMLTGLTIFEDAISNDFYGLQYLRPSDVEFSVLTTAISYSNISNYMGLDSRTDVEAANLNRDSVRDVFLWMFSQDPSSGETVLGESRNLKKLAAITGSDSAVEVLKRSKDLDLAYIHTEGPAEVFLEMLQSAKNSVSEAVSIVDSIDSLGIEHKELVGKISESVDTLEFIVHKRMKKQQAREGFE